jgi:hypothetical protein
MQVEVLRQGSSPIQAVLPTVYKDPYFQISPDRGEAMGQNTKGRRRTIRRKRYNVIMAEPIFIPTITDELLHVVD